MFRCLLSLSVALALPVAACTAPGEGDEYSWKRTPRAQLDVSTGIDIGVSPRGRAPARIAVVCDQQKTVRLVLRSKLPSTVTDNLPARDVLQLSFGEADRNLDLKPSFAVSTIRDGALASSVSDPLGLPSSDRLSKELAQTPRQLLAFGIRESLLKFEVSLTQDEFDQFVKSCRSDSNRNENNP